MDRTGGNTSVPSSSNIDSGVAVTFGSSTSQIVLGGVADVVVQQGVAAPAGGAQINAVYNPRIVQESNDRENDIDLRPPSAILFRYDGREIVLRCNNDVDKQNARVRLEEFKLFLQSIEKCRTCFIRRRGVINNPCGCFCNCRDCALVMSMCSLCGSRIHFTVQVIFQYESR
ncbi:hypothetical protein BsWGS_12339 [Bradybaena similaris]